MRISGSLRDQPASTNAAAPIGTAGENDDGAGSQRFQRHRVPDDPLDGEANQANRHAGRGDAHQTIPESGKAADPSPQHHEENREVQQRNQRRDQGEADVSPPEDVDRRPVQSCIRDDRSEADDCRRTSIFERIERWHQDLDVCIAREPDAVRDQSLRGHRGVMRREASVLVDETDDLRRERHESDRCRQAKREHQAQRCDDRGPKALQIRGGSAARDLRERDDPDRDAEQPDRQLHEAKGDVEPGDCAVAQPGGEVSIDEYVHLDSRGSDRRRGHQGHDLAHARIGERDHGAIAVSDPSQARQLDEKLKRTADQRTDCHSDDRSLRGTRRRRDGPSASEDPAQIGRAHTRLSQAIRRRSTPG